jgi:hypothetical protein
LPQTQRTHSITPSNITANNQTRFHINSQPDPLLLRFGTDKRPQLITLNR